MHKSQEFAGGITNGAHWYPLSGGMQVNFLNVTHTANIDTWTHLHVSHIQCCKATRTHKSQEFAGGIPNGAHWYPLSGGMQVSPVTLL